MVSKCTLYTYTYIYIYIYIYEIGVSYSLLNAKKTKANWGHIITLDAWKYKSHLITRLGLPNTRLLKDFVRGNFAELSLLSKGTSDPLYRLGKELRILLGEPHDLWFGGASWPLKILAVLKKGGKLLFPKRRWNPRWIVHFHLLVSAGTISVFYVSWYCL